MSSSLSAAKFRQPWIKVLLVVGLAAIATLTALPNLVSGNWPWVQPPQVVHIKALRALKQQGLTLPGWQAESHQAIDIHEHGWMLSEYRANAAPSQSPATDQVAVLLRPQPDHADQPTLEWVDLAGAQQWKTDSQRRATFTVPSPQNPQQTVRVAAGFSRNWNPQQTFAVLQWYAWPSGGNFSPNSWFWADQGFQWRTRQRLPWVAVTILVPIDPLGDIGPYEPFAIAVGQQVQSELMRGALTTDS